MAATSHGEPLSRIDQRKIPVSVPVVAAGAILLALAIVSLFQLRPFQQHLCPADTQVWGANDISLFVLPIPLILFAAVLAPPLVRRIRQARADSAIQVPTLLPLAMWIAGGAIILWGLLAINAAFSYYCLTPKEILVHSSLFASSKVYEWSDVEEVVAECSYVGGPHPRQILQLDLVMRDGQTFHAARGPLNIAVETVAMALGNQPYSYDTSGILDSCAQEYRVELLSPALMAHRS